MAEAAVEWSFADQGVFRSAVKELAAGQNRKDAIEKVVRELKVTASTTVHVMTAMKSKTKGAAPVATVKNTCEGYGLFVLALEDMARRAHKRRPEVSQDPAKQEEHALQ